MVKIFELKIENPMIYSLNRYRNDHFTVRSRFRDDCYLLFQSEIRKLKNIPIIKKYPVDVVFELEKPRPFDCDNIITKQYLDSLVHLGVLENDSPKFVRSVKVISKSSKKTKLHLLIYN